MKFPLFLVFIAGCATPSYVDAQAPRSPTPQSIAAPVRVETVAEGSSIRGASSSFPTDA
jgi:hypothetical protein